MNNDFSIIRLVLDASPVRAAILALLLLASIASWAVIIDKQPRAEAGHTAAAQEFEASFWSGVDLNSLYRDMARADATPHGMAGIFEAGFREFGKLKQDRAWARSRSSKESRRAMRVSHLREMDRLEHNLAFLATVSNTSPYVGLLGTVWGIMSSFQALGGMQSATIAMVAPGISEALIATAMGLFAAIPAGILLQPLRGSGGPARGALRHVHGRAVGDLPAQAPRGATRRRRGAGPRSGSARVRRRSRAMSTRARASGA